MRKYRIPLPDPPESNYKIMILPHDIEVSVDIKKIPFGKKGLPGSILDIVNYFQENIIEHTCGGVQACSTCHIYVKKGFDSCNEMSEREEDYLENSPSLKLNSRLACCCVPDGSENITIEIPRWNRNEVKE